MWLPKDERRLLLAYYLKLERVGAEGWFEEHNLAKMLASKSNVRKSVEELKDYFHGGAVEDQVKDTASDKFNVEEYKKRVKQRISNSKRVAGANCNLKTRELITIRPHQHVDGLNQFALTLDGYNLAVKYSKFLTYTQEWWVEYKGHWLWTIISYIVTFVLGLMTGRLTN